MKRITIAVDSDETIERIGKFVKGRVKESFQNYKTAKILIEEIE